MVSNSQPHPRSPLEETQKLFDIERFAEAPHTRECWPYPECPMATDNVKRRGKHRKQTMHSSHKLHSEKGRGILDSGSTIWPHWKCHFPSGMTGLATFMHSYVHAMVLCWTALLLMSLILLQGETPWRDPNQIVPYLKPQGPNNKQLY